MELRAGEEEPCLSMESPPGGGASGSPVSPSIAAPWAVGTAPAVPAASPAPPAPVGAGTLLSVFCCRLLTVFPSGAPAVAWAIPGPSARPAAPQGRCLGAQGPLRALQGTSTAGAGWTSPRDPSTRPTGPSGTTPRESPAPGTSWPPRTR